MHMKSFMLLHACVEFENYYMQNGYFRKAGKKLQKSRTTLKIVDNLQGGSMYEKNL